MGIFFCALVFTIVSVGLIVFAKHMEKMYCTYETRFIRGDVRAMMGKFAYKSMLEEKRKKLNSSSTKF